MAFGTPMKVQTRNRVVLMGPPPDGMLADVPPLLPEETAMLSERLGTNLREWGIEEFVRRATDRPPEDGQFWVLTSDEEDEQAREFLGFTDVFREDPKRQTALTVSPHNITSRILVCKKAQGGMAGPLREGRLLGALKYAPQMGVLAFHSSVDARNVKSLIGVDRMSVKVHDDPKRPHFAMPNPDPDVFAEYLQLATRNGLITPDMHAEFRKKRQVVAEALVRAETIVTLL